MAKQSIWLIIAIILYLDSFLPCTGSDYKFKTLDEWESQLETKLEALKVNGEKIPGKALKAVPVELYSPDKENESEGQYELEGGFWVKQSEGKYPETGAVVGDLENGVSILVARGKAAGGIIPGKFHPTYKLAYVAADNTETPLTNYEILTAKPGTLVWIPSSGGELVKGAVIGGMAEEGEELYICRCPYERTLSGMSKVPGKIQPSLKSCTYSWGFQQRSCQNYEILVASNSRGSGSKAGEPAKILGNKPMEVKQVTRVTFVYPDSTESPVRKLPHFIPGYPPAFLRVSPILTHLFGLPLFG